MTSKTLLKAKAIYQGGGVERVSACSYRVTSMSGRSYAVWTDFGRCTCAARGTCSHMAAVDIHRSKRHAARAA